MRADFIVLVWTVSAAIGVLVTFRGQHNARIDLHVQQEVARRKLLTPADAAQRLTFAHQRVLNQSWWFVSQIMYFCIGLVVAFDIEPLRQYIGLGLLVAQVAAVVLSVLDGRTQGYLLHAAGEEAP